MKTKWIILISSIAAVLIAAGITCFFLYRDVDIEITIEREQLHYGSEEDLGIRAVAKGRFSGKVYNLTPQITGEVRRDSVGEYELSVSAKQFGAEKTEKFIVTIVDPDAPKIELQTDPEYFTLPGSTYQEEGFRAIDDYDGDITERVERTATEEKVIYSVSDSSGNRTEVIRNIVYSDPVPPQITLLGDEEITQERRYPYEDPGATASDNYDGDITDRIVVDGEVDTTTIGDYQLHYSVTDSFGNIGIANRVIHIIERSKPIGEEEEAKGKVIYLTFDDGPGAYTQKLLDVLDKYNVKATFFVCNNGLDYLIAEEAKRGHTVAVHGWTHDYKKLYTSAEGFYENFYKMQDKIYELTGVRTNLLRFPGGSSNAVSRQYCKGIMTFLTKDVTEKGLYFFDWNVLAGDSEAQPISTEQVYRNVVNGVLYLKGKPAVVL